MENNIHMQLYLAPLEGITTYIYRNAYQKYFAPMDQYFAPFMVASEQRTMSKRESGDILPEHNQGLSLVPQILTNNASAFVKTASAIHDMGYQEINLNLGCPSGTVVAKGRGAGFLAEPEKLDQFLDKVFSWGQMDISVKTRIGKYDPEEFEELLEIFNRYPIRQLIIHPRVQQDFYGNKPNLSVFANAVEKSSNPVCYNGDIFTLQDYISIKERFPDLERVMLGRGVLGNPWLVQQIRTWELSGEKVDTGVLNLDKEDRIISDTVVRIEDMTCFREFHDTILTAYQNALSGDRNVLFKMKELWVYFLPLFPNGEKEGKLIRKAQRVAEYKSIVEGLFSSFGRNMLKCH
ncbi:MAG: tRNA-dihydrouridine synthase family protein [Lachnospiraceae bacterium]|nr:tRNA-dihydrouridine synthase family protein [Lachnospiraceae bacterium]